MALPHETPLRPLRLPLLLSPPIERERVVVTRRSILAV
jgi:hypothetical protein